MDAGQPPTILTPRPERLFGQRAARMRDLARSVPSLSGFLLLMADLAERQARLIATNTGRAVSLERNLPGTLIDTEWGEKLVPVLQVLLKDLPAPSAAVSQTLTRIADADDSAVNRWVADLRSGQPLPADVAVLPFIAAALQLELTCLAAEVEPGSHGHDQGGEASRCPVCANWPIASMLQTVGDTQGLRYLHCGFCASAWSHPRIQCVNCGSSEHLAYQSIEGTDTGEQAETCDACHVYLKRIDRDKKPGADPIADDLATLGLDLMLNERGYQRLGMNPFLLIPAELG